MEKYKKKLKLIVFYTMIALIYMSPTLFATSAGGTTGRNRWANNRFELNNC